MLSCSVCKQMFTSRKLKKCALVCTTHVQHHFCLFATHHNFFRSSTAIDLVSTDTHVYLFGSFQRALRWRENATIKKTCGQSITYSDVINFYSIIAVVRWIHHSADHCIVPAYTGPACFLLWLLNHSVI